MKKKALKIIVILLVLSSCKNEVVENVSENQIKEYLVLGESSKKISKFPLPWLSDSYFLEITYPELKSLYDNRKEPNFCKHYIIVETSCGTGCVLGAMIDIRNGEHYELPKPRIEGWDGNGNISIEYNNQYNLLIAHQELMINGEILACTASWQWSEKQKKFNLIYPVVIPTLKTLN